MQILAIESSSLTAGAAIIKDDVVLAEYSVSFKKTHSQTLLPMIDEVVKMTETNLKELDAIAISAGPGSFTGLRIGSATAKGLCLALDKPLVEVSTLEAMAFGCGPYNGLICPMIDARRRQVYTALYRFDEELNMVCVMEPKLLLVEELAQNLKELKADDENVLFTGDGMQVHGAWLKENVSKSKMAPAVCSTPRAAAVAELGAKISADYEGKEIKLICILKGSIFFCCELAKRITVPVKIDFMQTSSYGSGTTSSGNIVIKKELDESIEGEHVIVVEDIIDSGNTLFRLMPMLEERNPADICICTLLDKPDRREVDIDVKYNGFNIPDEFVVGYGLDYDQMYRNLPFIGVVHLDDEN